MAANEWHHYALVWTDGGTADLYVDGVNRGGVPIGTSWKGGNKVLFGKAAGGPSGLTNAWQGRHSLDKYSAYYGLTTSRFPVSGIDWDDAIEFCRRLSVKEGKTYRLRLNSYQDTYASQSADFTFMVSK